MKPLVSLPAPLDGDCAASAHGAIGLILQEPRPLSRQQKLPAHFFKRVDTQHRHIAVDFVYQQFDGVINAEPAGDGRSAQKRTADEAEIGAEGEGLRRLTRETCDEVAGLTIKGAVESLNVSAAAAVALYELSRA